eukprot:765927-Hanusia_phi.AAC.2
MNGQEAEQDKIPIREKNNAEVISKGFKLAEDVLADSQTGDDLKLSILKETADKYCEAKTKLKDKGELVPFYFESKITEYLQDILKRREVSAPKRKERKGKGAAGTAAEEEEEEDVLGLSEECFPAPSASSQWDVLLRNFKERSEAESGRDNGQEGTSSVQTSSPHALPTFSHHPHMSLDEESLPVEERISRELEAELEEALAEEEVQMGRTRQEKPNREAPKALQAPGGGGRQARTPGAGGGRRKGREGTREAEGGKRKRIQQGPPASRGGRTARRRRGDEWEDYDEREEEEEEASQSERFQRRETKWTVEAVSSFLQLVRRMATTRNCFLAALPTPAALLREDG